MQSDPLLPALPVPELDAACATLLDLARPLLTEAEYAGTERAVKEFAGRQGPGRPLHDALLRWKSSLNGNRSWLRPFWDDMYLEYREPLPINMNYTFCLDPEVWGRAGAPAAFIHTLTRVLLDLWGGRLPPEPSATPLDMEQSRFVLYTRIPVAGKDVLVHCQPVADPYALVLCRGRSFLLRLTGKDGAAVSAAAIAKGLEAVRKAAAGRELRVNPFLYSVMRREEAAEIRADLVRNLNNRVRMALLEQALFAICLDEESADNAPRAFEHDVLAGPPENRFFEKSLQIICRADGKTGVNIEHAGCDAPIWLYMFSRAAELLRLEESPDALPEAAPPVLLDWRISAASACKLAAAGEAFIARKNRLDLARLVLPEYSRARVKALRCSPDAFLQMGFQAAQYQCLPRFSSSYEAVSMRAFAEGRTECARGSSAEAGALAEALCRCRPAGEIRELFRKAEARHLDRLEQCRSGQGVERYMLGLESMYLLYGQALGVSVPPALFANPGWQFVKRNLLSTSGSVSSVCNAFGFGPPDPEGFGLGYNYGAALTVTVTGFPQSSRAAEEFAAALKNHLDALFSALAGA